MGYIVKNCPAIISLYERHQCALASNYYCADCTDCLLKRVIEKCKHFKSALDYDKGSVFVAQEILVMFDIEEINK